MTSVPLLLENHFFTKVVVEANPAYEPEKNEEQPFGIQTEVQVGQHKDDPRRWRVILNLRTESTAEKEQPYKIDLECAGFFKVDHEVEEKRMPFLVRANGASILYSSAREFLLLVTGRGPWDPVYLPTTNFLEPPKGEEKPKLTESAPKAIKKKRVSKAKKIIEQSEEAKSES